MAIARKLGEAIDNAIGIVSPKRGLMRRKMRSMLYAAAKTTKSTGVWSPVNSNVNVIIGASSAKIRARVRQLVRDFPYFARAVNVSVDYVVGDGIKFQSRIQKPSGDLDQRRIQQTEDVFNFWADEADYAGKLHYYEIMRLAKRQDAECGEFLLVKRYDAKTKSRYLPYCLQTIEPDWLTDYNTTPMGKTGASIIDQGIEYDLDSGRIIAYHFRNPDTWSPSILGRTERIAAADVIHGFDVLRPGQLRGVSPFAPGVLVADDLAMMMDSEIDSAKMASKYLALVKTMDPISRQAAAGVQDGDYGEKIEDLENAIIEYLRPGEDVELTSNPRPGANFMPFVRLVLCMFSVTTGLPYELLSGDYQGMNYSTGKLVRNDFRQALRPLWGRHIRHYCTPTLTPFYNSAVLTGKLTYPGYASNPYRWQLREMQPPGMESQDPLRESKANIDDIAAVLKSPQEIIKARGRDPEAVVKEAAAFKKLCEENGISVADVSTALANNPAAVTGQDAGVSGRAADFEIMDLLESISARV